MVIHFMKDEKFIDSFVEQYESTHTNEEKIYYIYLRDSNNQLKHVTNKAVEIITLNSKKLKEIISKNKNINSIYFHNFPKNLFSLYRHIPKTIKICWIFYGAEIYQNVLHTNILDENSEVAYVASYKMKRLMRFLPTQIVKLRLLLGEKYRIYKLGKILSRIDFFCHWNKYDYERVKELFPMFHAQFIHFGYNHSFSMLQSQVEEETLSFENDLKTVGKTIMLGHSATASLNHLTILKYLKQFGNQSFRIVCPVSYGDMDYKKIIVQYAKVNKIENLTLLEEFLSFQEYAKLISNIDVLIMNNIRALGGGNISLALKMGKKVYMNPQNTHYKYFMDLGFIIYSISDLFQSSLSEILTPLNLEEKNHNRKLITELPVMSTAIYMNLP